jgi:hypothetical protein
MIYKIVKNFQGIQTVQSHMMPESAMMALHADLATFLPQGLFIPSYYHDGHVLEYDNVKGVVAWDSSKASVFSLTWNVSNLPSYHMVECESNCVN